jgi:hypothetical protein
LNGCDTVAVHCGSEGHCRREDELILISRHIESVEESRLTLEKCILSS